MERIKEPLLIIGHQVYSTISRLSFLVSPRFFSKQAILRVLYCYFMGLPREACPTIEIPLHTVFHLQHETYGCKEEKILLIPVDGADDDAPSH